MANYSTTIETPWQRKIAFAYLADLRNFAEWDPGVSKVDLVGGVPGAADAIYDVTASGTTLRYEVTHLDAPERLVVRAKNRLFESIDTISIAANGDAARGCRATYAAELQLNGPLGLVDPLLGLAFKRIGDRAAAGLEAALEGTRVGTS